MMEALEAQILEEVREGRYERLFHMGESLLRQWKLDEATTLLEQARRVGRSPPRLFHDLSVLYAQQGFFREANAAIEEAMERDPSHRAHWHHLLALQKNSPEPRSRLRWRGMHLAYGDTLRERFDARHLQKPRSRDPGRRLRIGYLSPDTHLATSRFIWPVLQHFDRNAFEVFAYWAHPSDAQREVRYPDARHRSIVGLDDAAIVDAVLGDGVDILVDVAGHGAGNALPALAARAAPVQMTWLDYLATTGLETVDYRITDAVADPPGAESAHVEALIRLPVPQWCYRGVSAVRAGPMQARRGPVVFGSVCVPLKLSGEVLDLWARVLAEVPESRMRFLGIPVGRARQRIEARMDAAGIGTARIEFLPRLSQEEFLAALSQIDIVLDSHPFSGATSTFDALAHGTPVVTLAGEPSHSRSAASILDGLGRRGWVADSARHFVEIAVALARDEAGRAVARRALPRELESSDLTDGRRFMAALERAFRGAWHTWLERTSGAVPLAQLPANSRADVLLSRAASAPQEGEFPSARCRGLLATLPSHQTTSRVFWTEVATYAARERASRGAGISLASLAEIVLVGGSDAGVATAASLAKAGYRVRSLEEFEASPNACGLPWVLFTAGTHYDIASLPATIEPDVLEHHDALASMGADSLATGDIFCAGRGHVSGVVALAEPDSGRVYCNVWVPDGMGPCAVLSGPALLARRKRLAGHPLPWKVARSEADFRYGVIALSHSMHRAGARLGIMIALALLDRTIRLDLVSELAAQRALERHFGLDHWDRMEVAASPVKGALPRAEWPRIAAALGSLFARLA